MKIAPYFTAILAALLLSACAGYAHAAGAAKAKPPSIQVIQRTEVTQDDLDAAEMKPLVHVPVKLPHGASRFAHMAMLAEVAYDELEERHVGTERIGGRNAVLALWRPDDPSYGLDIVNIIDGISRTEDVEVEVLKAEGLGSKYLVKVGSNTGLEVFAMRINITDEKWEGKIKRTDRVQVRGKKKKSAWKTVTRSVKVTYFTTEPVVYIPYADSQIDLEAAMNGRQYLYDLDAVARFILRQRNVRSKADPSKYVYELVPPHLTVTALINEHTDHKEFDDLGVIYTTQKVFVTTALNRDTTYDYSGSWAGAYGYAQFIRPSYKDTVTKCPRAKLIPDFHEGMRDHVNAVMAQYCYKDATLMVLTPQQRARLLKPENADLLGLWLAAAYNGSPVRAAKAYTVNTAGWTTTPCSAFPKKKAKRTRKGGKAPIASAIRPCLAEETLFYLKKHKAILQLLRGMAGETGPEELQRPVKAISEMD